MKITIDYPKELHDSDALAIAYAICHESGGVQWQKPHEKYWEALGYGVEVSGHRKDTVFITIKEGICLNLTDTDKH